MPGLDLDAFWEHHLAFVQAVCGRAWADDVHALAAFLG
jgi:hypothetical protein